MHFQATQWLSLVAALILLLPPVSLLHDDRVRYRPIARDWDRHWQQVLSLRLHLLDFLRSILGVWLLAHAVEIVPGGGGSSPLLVLGLGGGIPVVASLIQTLGCKEPESIHASFAFVAGLVLGGVTPVTGAFAVVLASALTIGSRVPMAFFPLLALAYVGIGHVLDGTQLMAQRIATACAVLMPWLCSILLRLRLVISYRAKRHGEGVPSLPAR